MVADGLGLIQKVEQGEQALVASVIKCCDNTVFTGMSGETGAMAEPRRQGLLQQRQQLVLLLEAA